MNPSPPNVGRWASPTCGHGDTGSRKKMRCSASIQTVRLPAALVAPWKSSESGVNTKKSRKFPTPAARRWFWEPHELAWLGKLPDGDVARRIGRSKKAVSKRRHYSGIPAINPPPPRWPKADIALLGKLPDAEIARQTGRQYITIHIKRRKLGIPNSAGKIHPWTKAEDRLLGTASDEQIAQKLNRNANSIYKRRHRLGIPPGNTKLRLWTPQEDILLGRYSDKILAKRLKRSRASVKKRRHKLGIASCHSNPASVSGSASG
jgi:hypothetical protein